MAKRYKRLEVLMKNIIDKCIDYDLFTDNKDVYPYLENDDAETRNCKLKIKIWLKVFLQEIKKLGYVYAYSIENKKTIKMDDLIHHDKFLFYSYEEGTSVDSFILNKYETIYNNRDDWEQDPQGILLVNDHDGLGLCFFMEKDILAMLEKCNIPLWNKLS